MKLIYFLFVIIGIILYILINHINTFIIGNPYIYNPPVDTPISSELEIYRGRVWNTIEEMQGEFARDNVDFGLIVDPTNDINFIPESNTSPITISTNNGNINFNVVNTIGRVNTRAGSETGCEKRVVISKGSSDGTKLKDTDTNISDTEFAIKLKKYLGTEHVEDHSCVFRIDVDIYTGRQRIDTCTRYLYLSYGITIDSEDDIVEMFTMDRIQRALDRSHIFVPFVYLIFCQLNIENLNIPDRFQTFFVGQELVAFEVSSVGNRTLMNSFQLPFFCELLEDLRVGFPEVLSPIEVEIFTDLTPLTPEEIESIESNDMSTNTMKKYVKHLRKLVNDENILIAIKVRVLIFLDWDTQFIINGSNIGVFDFDRILYKQEIIDITLESYNTLSNVNMNSLLSSLFEPWPVGRINDETFQIFGPLKMDELMQITCNILEIYQNMISIGIMTLENINTFFKMLLYNIKYRYSQLQYSDGTFYTWTTTTQYTPFLTPQFIQLQNLLFGDSDLMPDTAVEIECPPVTIVTSDDDAEEYDYDDLSSTSDDDDDLCEPEPETEPDTECISTCSSCESHSD